MATLGDLYSRIYQEVHQTRTDATVNAVKSAVDFYRSTRFWCNEATSLYTVSVSASGIFAQLTAFPGAIEIDKMIVWAQGQPYDLEPTSWGEIMAKDEGNTRGVPTDWAVHHQRIRLYPVPNATYTIEATYLHAASLSASLSHSSVWTNELEPLIRARAKAVLYADFFLDDQKAQSQYAVEKLYLQQFLDRTTMNDPDTGKQGYL